MVEYQIEGLECIMLGAFTTYKKASFLILVAVSLLEIMDWTGSKAFAITTSKICVLLQMVHGGRRKSIPIKKDMDVSFV